MTKGYHVIALIALLMLLIKLGFWLSEPTKPLIKDFEYVENDKMTCWRFTDDQGRGPGHWNCKDKK